MTFTPAPVSATGNFTDERAQGEPGRWLGFIKDRLGRDLPLPSDAAERRRLLDCAVRDLFGMAPTPEETAALVADRSPEAFENLTQRLAQRAGTLSFTGTLQSGATKFRVLPADPDAATKPRTAIGPGRYTLRAGAVLAVSRRPQGERVVNEATIQFSSAEGTKFGPAKPSEIKLPDGYNTWAAAWVRGTGVLWVMQAGAVRRYDFTDPARVKETTLAGPANRDQLPKPILEALRAAERCGSGPSARLD